MKRPSQHITETKSQRIFERIVPVEWVCREIKPDYGVDYLVEIFENNESTGRTFFVQLKGSTQKIENETFKKQLTTDNLKYYNSLSIPVILICVSVTTEKIWGIWVNKFIDKNQKSISVSLNKDYQLDKIRLKKIASDADLSSKLGLSIVTDSSITKNFNNHLLRWIDHYYSNSVATNFCNLPNHLKLTYKSKDDKSLQVSIQTSNYTKSITINNFNEEESFLYRPEFDNEDVNEFNKEILLSIAISLAKHDIQGTLKLLIKLVGKLDLTNKNDWIHLDPLGLLVLAQGKNVIHLFNKLVREIIKAEMFEMFMFFDLAYFAIGTRDLQKYRIKNLNAVIESQTDMQLLGTCYYNIGNILRSQFEDAIGNYFKAVKLLPDYRNRDYWWREIAGLFFVKKYYICAENCYKKSLNLSVDSSEEKKYLRLVKDIPDEQNLVSALIADCLFFQGKFREANKYFKEYFKFTESKSQEWILKNMTCLELMNNELDNVKIDRKQSIKLCETSLKLTNNEDVIAILKKAIKLNPVNGLAWFNLGVTLDKAQKYEEALFAFLMTGLVQDGDKEAQFNALTISFNLEKYKMIQALLVFIREKHGETVINDLSDYIMNKNMSLEEKKHLINAFTDMMEVINNEHSA